jgi:hypothetical protein
MVARRAGPAIEVEGLAELSTTLRKLGEGIDDLKGAGLAAATIVAEAAQSIAPVESGGLAGSIRPAGQAKGGVVRAGSAGRPYAGPIHFGWAGHGIEPQPFLYEAADSRVDEVADAYLAGVAELAANLEQGVTT